ncbi:MAG: peptidase [Myxococcales bacterium]|nr:peptidase [Myxococcales bacterium]
MIARLLPRTVTVAILVAAAAPALADPTPPSPAPPSASRERPAGTTPFSPDVYRARRARLMGLMKKGVGVILSATPRDKLDSGQDTSFMYLTGLWDERDAGLLLAPENPPEEREQLFLAAARPERDRWSGYRALLPSRAVEQRVGFELVRRIEQLGWELAMQLSRHKVLQYFGAPLPYDTDPPKIAEIYEKTAKRVIGAKTEDAHLILGRMRMTKEPREVEKIQRATDITVAGHLAAMRRVHPGMHEWELKQIVEDTFRSGGARRLSYPSIVGAGPDGCVLHYPEDDRVIEDGELVLIDAGAEFDHYATDVTRTFPASGHFTPEQRRAYDTVLKAQNAALAKVRPGVTWNELQRVAEKVMTEAGYYEYFIHGLGHHVGLEVHDVEAMRYEPIAEGSVITIEPGIYIPEKKIGVRIEDTVLVTKAGPKILSAALPRGADEIERLMAKPR